LVRSWQGKQQRAEHAQEGKTKQHSAASKHQQAIVGENAANSAQAVTHNRLIPLLFASPAPGRTSRFAVLYLILL
jgi:hypothetical protein